MGFVLQGRRFLLSITFSLGGLYETKFDFKYGWPTYNSGGLLGYWRG